MTTTIIHIDQLRQFSADGQVYRAFGHLIAARMGSLLLVPLPLVEGRLDQVLDGCPVSWEEVFAVLEYPARHPLTNPAQWHGADSAVRAFTRLGLDLTGCVLDHITPMVQGKETTLRLTHPCGVRFAEVMA